MMIFKVPPCQKIDTAFGVLSLVGSAFGFVSMFFLVFIFIWNNLFSCLAGGFVFVFVNNRRKNDEKRRDVADAYSICSSLVSTSIDNQATISYVREVKSSSMKLLWNKKIHLNFLLTRFSSETVAFIIVFSILGSFLYELQF